MNVVFRTNAGERIGFGHLRRCLSLAATLTGFGCDCTFLLGGDLSLTKEITTAGFSVAPAGGDDDLYRTNQYCREIRPVAVVIDGYRFGPAYFDSLRDTRAVLVALDDLAAGEIPADVVVNGSVGADRFFPNPNGKAVYLLGPRYILLRPEFSRQPERRISESVERLLITVGGSDTNDLTLLFIEAAAGLPGLRHTDVIVGPFFHNVSSIETAARQCAFNVTLHYHPPNMRDLMVRADMALCSGGQTTFELAAAATPSIAVRTVDNQTRNLDGFSETGVLIWVGDVADPDIGDRVRNVCLTLIADVQQRLRLSERGRGLVDGNGTSRVAKVMLEMVQSRL